MPFVSRHISGEEAAWFNKAGEANKEGEVPPMQSITFDVDDVVGNAVDASIEQVVAYLKSEMA